MRRCPQEQADRWEPQSLVMGFVCPLGAERANQHAVTLEMTLWVTVRSASGLFTAGAQRPWAKWLKNEPAEGSPQSIQVKKQAGRDMTAVLTELTGREGSSQEVASLRSLPSYLSLDIDTLSINQPAVQRHNPATEGQTSQTSQLRDAWTWLVSAISVEIKWKFFIVSYEDWASLASHCCGIQWGQLTLVASS